VVEAGWGRSPKQRISEEDKAWKADLIAVGTYRFLMLTISADDTSHESGTVAYDDDARISRLHEQPRLRTSLQIGFLKSFGTSCYQTVRMV
jgi:hypothetical protein